MAITNKVSRSLQTPLKFLKRNAVVYAEKVAIVDGQQRYTYRKFGERVNRLASALRIAGIEKGDRVAILCPNTAPMLEAHFGVPLAGAALVAINTRLSSGEIAYIINHSGARSLLVDAELADCVRPVVGELESVQQTINVGDLSGASPLEGPNYESFLSGGSPEPVPWRIEDEEETIAINYTSGTTGRPKGVKYSHRGAYLNALGEMLETGVRPESVYLWTLPMFHCNGWCFTWGVTAMGAQHIGLRKPQPGEIWRMIAEHGVTHLNGAPVVMVSMLEHPSRPKRLDRELTVTIAGAPPSPTLLEQLEELGARVVHAYGLTETYGPHTVCALQSHWASLPPAEQARLRARQGVGYVATDDVRVVDEQMNDVPADGQTLGEVVMQGNNVMAGYYNDPEATARAFRGGWFHSGDVAVMHPDGYIELRDRSGDVIVSGGEKISSIEVEQALYRHPAVLEVAVIGIPAQKWGETPKAFVTLRTDAEVTESELIEFCREQIAHFKCPSAVEFAALPKTSTGKIQKYVLRNKEWAGREKRIQGA